MKEELRKAVDLALKQQWDAAHKIVQDMDGHPIANWIHAVLHKIEGDRANSMYWYSRAGKTEYADHDPSAELKVIQAELES
jgi:CHASE3 domain sensor protein